MPDLLAIPGIEDNFFSLTLFLQNLSNALANGAVYSLMALTVVMIYKTTGHLNFAQGEMAMFTTFIVFVLAVEQGLNVWLAMGLVVIMAMIVGAAVERILIQPLESRSVLAPVILTLGLFFILNGGAAVIWDTQPRTPIPAPFPGGLDDKIDIITNRSPNFFITYKALGVWITVAVLVIGLNLLLKRTKLGLAYRAVAANAESSLIVGIPVKRMLMLGWALAAGIGPSPGRSSPSTATSSTSTSWPRCCCSASPRRASAGSTRSRALSSAACSSASSRRSPRHCSRSSAVNCRW